MATATGGRVLLHRDVDDQCAANVLVLVAERQSAARCARARSLKRRASCFSFSRHAVRRERLV